MRQRACVVHGSGCGWVCGVRLNSQSNEVLDRRRQKVASHARSPAVRPRDLGLVSADSPSIAHMERLTARLATIGLEKYADAFADEGYDDFDVLAQAGTDEHLVDEDEPLDERHAQRVAEFGRRSPRPALRPIQSYEIWVYSSGQHGMHDGCELRRVADAELEADWLAVGETCDTSVTLHPNVKPKRLAVVAAVGRQRGE